MPRPRRHRVVLGLTLAVGALAAPTSHSAAALADVTPAALVPASEGRARGLTYPATAESELSSPEALFTTAAPAVVPSGAPTPGAALAPVAASAAATTAPVPTAVSTGHAAQHSLSQRLSEMATLLGGASADASHAADFGASEIYPDGGALGAANATAGADAHVITSPVISAPIVPAAHHKTRLPSRAIKLSAAETPPAASDATLDLNSANTITLETKMSVAVGLGSNRLGNARSFARHVKEAAELAVANSTVSVVIKTEDNIAVAFPESISLDEMQASLSRVVCARQSAPACFVTRASPTDSMSTSEAAVKMQSSGGRHTVSEDDVAARQMNQSNVPAITFEVERNMGEDSGRSLEPLQINAAHLARELSENNDDGTVSASDISTSNHGHTIEAISTIRVRDAGDAGASAIAAAEGQAANLATAIGGTESDFAFTLTPAVGSPNPPPPPPPYLAPTSAHQYESRNWNNWDSMATAKHALKLLSGEQAELLSSAVGDRAEMVHRMAAMPRDDLMKLATAALGLDDHAGQVSKNAVAPSHLDPELAELYSKVNGHALRSTMTTQSALTAKLKAATALEADVVTSQTLSHSKTIKSGTTLQAPAEGLIFNQTNMTGLDRPVVPEDNFYIEETDMAEPELQATGALQDEMHATYANENASKTARLRTTYPTHLVPFTPMAHINRPTNDLSTCPGMPTSTTPMDMRVALQAFARTAQWRAPSCYANYAVSDTGAVSLVEAHRRNTPAHVHPIALDDQPGVAPAKILVSETYRFIFLGLPGNHSSAIEDYIACTYDAVVMSEAIVAERVGPDGVYSGYAKVGVQFGAALRMLHKYGETLNQMHDLMFASEGQHMLPGEVIGLPELRTERYDASLELFAGINATLSMPGTANGLLEYMLDAARAHAVGCRGEWWADEGAMDDITPAEVLAMYRRNAIIAPSGMDFTFEASSVYNDTTVFDSHMADAAATARGPQCLRPLSSSHARMPEPAAIDLLDTLHLDVKAQRFICALHWQELVCAGMLPDACGPDAPLIRGGEHPAPNGTAYAWLDETLLEVDHAEPNVDLHAMGIDSGNGQRPSRDFESEEEALICGRLDEMSLRQEMPTIGIVTVDSRAYTSPVQAGVKMWQAYAAAHGYVYISLHPGGDLIKSPRADQDWIASTRLLETMLSDQYAHIHHFMYTEVDQWMTRPLTSLGELFRGVGLHRCDGPIMAAVGLPLNTSSGEQRIDTGTFLFRRSPKMRQLLHAWSNQTYGYENGDNTTEISRSYAFTANPGVYATFAEHVRIFGGLGDDRLPIGLPYSPMIQHAFDRSIPGRYDGEMAREAQAAVIQPCVLAALLTGEDHTCSLHPPMAGGTCSMCSRQLSLRLPNGTDHTFTATQCCHEADAAIPVQKYYELAAIFEAADPTRIKEALIDIYEGRAPMSTYHSRLHHLLPEVGSSIPEAWLHGPPTREPLEPALSQRLYYKAPIFMPSCEAWGMCDAPEGCFEEMLAVSKLPTTEVNQFHDYAHCLSDGNAGSASALNSYCTAEYCHDLAAQMKADHEPINGGVGIVTIDSRTVHPTIEAWRAYAALHGYTYMHLISVASAEDVEHIADINMLFDWRTNLMLLNMLQNETYAHVDYFLYTELDQWITSPHTMKLEPLFQEHGLADNRNDFVAVEEYPCRDVRGGGVFNMGTFLFRRGQGIVDLLTAWYQSTQHGGEHNATWPARQGAFSHDPLVYHAFKDRISIMPSACPLGSPYGIALGHVLGGSIVGAFDPERGRDVFQTLILPCVQDAIDSGADHTCSLHPPWSGGSCVMCEQTLSFARPDGTMHNITAKACCGEVDAAMQLQKFRETAAIFEGANVDGIVEALKGVYEGRGPKEMYALLGVGVLPSEWRVQWNAQAAQQLSEAVPLTAQEEAAEMAELRQQRLGYPSPPAPPPHPSMCDTPECEGEDSWIGPRRLLYVAPAQTADTLYLDLFRHIHLYTGMPYAWGGRHAGWLTDATKRGLECAADVDPQANPANGDAVSCRCFLDYLITFNLTADGLWICHDTVGAEYNTLLATAMPNATWVTTLKDPWNHAIDMFNLMQAPYLNASGLPPLTSETSTDTSLQCEYDGPGFRTHLSAPCFMNYFVDPVHRRCIDGDASLIYSQLCALGHDLTPTDTEISAQYHVLPAEEPVTSLLAALYLDFGVPLDVVRRIHDSLEHECHYGSELSNPSYQSWLNETDTLWPGMLNGSHLAELQAKESTFQASVAESGLLHQRAVAASRAKVAQYYTAMNLTLNSACWHVSEEPVPARSYTMSATSDHNRYTIFDNSNYKFSNVRVDQCVMGMPEAVDTLYSHHPHTHSATSAALADWLHHARPKSPQCFNSTGYAPDMTVPFYSDAMVSTEYKIAFETTAKAGSMSATNYMQCRFNAEQNGLRSNLTSEPVLIPSYQNYTKMTIMRDPLSRAISSVFEVAMHYIAILRLSPANLRACANAMRTPNMKLELDELMAPNSYFPPICAQTWGRAPYDQNHTFGQFFFDGGFLNKAELLATADSAFMNKIWALPAGCRQVGRGETWGRDKVQVCGGQVGPIPVDEDVPSGPLLHGLTWWCEEGANCTAPCEVTDEQQADLFNAALSDAAKQNMLGCGQNHFGGEHMWPQFTHMSRAGRIDAVMHFEDMETGTAAFETYVERKLGRSLPPNTNNCSMVGPSGSASNVGTVIEQSLTNSSGMGLIIQRSTQLQQRICAMYYHDFTCGGYELLPACRAPVSEWLDRAMADLLAHAPVTDLTAGHVERESVAGRIADWAVTSKPAERFQDLISQARAML